MGYSSNFSVCAPKEQADIVQQCVEQYGGGTGRCGPQYLLREIEKAKLNADRPGELKLPEDASLLSFVCQRYTRRLQESDSIDYTDFLHLAVQLLATNPAVLDQYQRQYSCCFVDDRAMKGKRRLKPPTYDTSAGRPWGE